MKWNKTPPPKDKHQPFIAVVESYPWASEIVWNEHAGRYNYVELQASHIGDKVDVWFENDQVEEDKIIAWIPMPVWEDKK